MSHNPNYNDMNSKLPTPTVASVHVSYTPVEATEILVNEEEHQIPVAVGYNDVPHAHDLHRANKVSSLRRVHSDYVDIPEARDLVWHDDFFDDDDDVVAVFDFDYETMESYYSSVGWCYVGLSLLYTPIFTVCMLGLVPCFLKRNVRWNVNAQHVAITRDGIRFVRDRRQTCWGLACTDAGKSSKTVPFDKITDCDIEEPAGNTCCLIPNVLVKVRIDTASSGRGDGAQRHELEISGLHKAREFKKLVWAMKRRYGAVGAGGSSSFSIPPYQVHPQAIMAAMQMSGRGGADASASASASASSDDVTALLREIRDELRHNNNLLVSMKEKDHVLDDQSTLILE